MDNKCPIDGTKLGPFNRYDLQDATICRSCAKKLDLVGKHQSLELANAAHALLTLNVAKDYLNASKQINYKELKSEYKNAVHSGDAPTGREMFRSATQEAGNQHIQSDSTESSSKKPKKSCAICGKSLGFLDPDIKFIDGYVCGDCAHKVGLRSRMSDIQWAENHNISDVKTLLDSGEIINTKSLLVAEKKRIADEKAIQRKQQLENYHNTINEIDNSSLIEGTDANTSQLPGFKKEPKQEHHFTGLKCPRCGSTNIQLISSQANIKRSKKSVSLNLNPLHPLTPFNVKEKKIKKRSRGKLAAAVLTGGASLAVTGTKSNKSHEYHCQDCGKTFTTK